MIATTATLRALLEAASPGPWTWGDVTVKTENAEIRLASDMDAKLAALAPALAEELIRLREVLREVMEDHPWRDELWRFTDETEAVVKMDEDSDLRKLLKRHPLP